MSDGVGLVSVVIPVYNSPVLGELIRQIHLAFERRPEEHEVIFVDDASPDPRTWSTLESLSACDERVQAIRLARNCGQHAATLYGLREAQGETVITMDDDLEHDPLAIPELLTHAGHDIVIAQLSPRPMPSHRRLEGAVRRAVDSVLIRRPSGVRLSSYRVLSRRVVDRVVTAERPRPFLPSMIFEASRDAVGVPVRRRPRRGGRSGYSLAKRMRLFGDLLASHAPERVRRTLRATRPQARRNDVAARAGGRVGQRE